MSYIAFIVVLGALFFLLSFCAVKREERFPASNSTLDTLVHLFGYKCVGECVLLGIWVLCILSPLFYEFPRWESDKWHMVQGVRDKSGGLQFTRPRKVPWYGTFHPLFARVHGFELADGQARASYAIVVEDTKALEGCVITVQIQCASWADFLFDINDAPVSGSDKVFCASPSLVIEGFARALRRADVPFENVPAQAEDLCNRWLSNQRIHSVQASVTDVKRFTRPNREVWIQW